jgi:hypothetical protein
MRISATTAVQEILGAFPDAADVLDWYGVDPEEVEGKPLTVRELCKTYEVELEEMLTDLQALADEEDADEEDAEDEATDDEDLEDEDDEDLEDEGEEDDDEDDDDDEDEDDDDDDEDDDEF